MRTMMLARRPAWPSQTVFELVRDTFAYERQPLGIVEHFEAVTAGVLGFRLSTGDPGATA
jgi:hypothetical protein